MLPHSPWVRALWVGLVFPPAALGAQAAVDPSIAPRAAQLARAGARPQAAELLSQYLATAPDDAMAWLELGKLYLADSREWHAAGHHGEPAGSLFLDFAATALDQSLRLPTDSARLVRGLVDLDRFAALVEEAGWGPAWGALPRGRLVAPPGYVVEIGRNLIRSCPAAGVLVTWSDLESVAVWAATLDDPGPRDRVVLLAARYLADSMYRRRMAETLGIANVAGVREALEAAATRRPVCLTPGIDVALTPEGPLAPRRLVRVAGPSGGDLSLPLSVAAILQAEFGHPDPLTREVITIYQAAARLNPALCLSLLARLGPQGREGCGR